MLSSLGKGWAICNPQYMFTARSDREIHVPMAPGGVRFTTARLGQYSSSCHTIHMRSVRNLGLKFRSQGICRILERRTREARAPQLEAVPKRSPSRRRWPGRAPPSPVRDAGRKEALSPLNPRMTCGIRCAFDPRRPDQLRGRIVASPPLLRYRSRSRWVRIFTPTDDQPATVFTQSCNDLLPPPWPQNVLLLRKLFTSRSKLPPT